MNRIFSVFFCCAGSGWEMFGDDWNLGDDVLG